LVFTRNAFARSDSAERIDPRRRRVAPGAVGSLDVALELIFSGVAGTAESGAAAVLRRVLFVDRHAAHRESQHDAGGRDE
jgi:hypothetical protein